MNLLSIITLLSAIATIEAYKILVYNSKYGHSHSNFLGMIADTLVDAGHNVVCPNYCCSDEESVSSIRSLGGSKVRERSIDRLFIIFFILMPLVLAIIKLERNVTDLTDPNSEQGWQGWNGEIDEDLRAPRSCR